MMAPTESSIDALLSRRFMQRSGVEPKKELDRAEKLIKQLQKKVKDGNGLDLFLTAIIEKDPNYQCICMPRNGDGRTQVGGKKLFPHVEFLRMYRYPGLQNHNQVRPMGHCTKPFHKKMSHVCINPYHYYLVDNAEIEITPQPDSPTPSSSSATTGQKEDFDLMDTTSSVPSNNPPPIALLPIACNNMPMQPLSIAIFDANTTHNHMWNSPADSGYGLSYISDHLPTSVSPPYNPNSDANGNMNSPTLPVPDWEHVYWCKVHYWEMNKRIGDPFVTESASFFIDGYTAPNEVDRFCLGSLSNVNRDPKSQNVINHIDRGVRIYTGYGEVGIECVGGKAVFVQSPSCNKLNHWPDDYVFKLMPGESVRIFSHPEFASLLDPLKDYSYNCDLAKMCTFRISFIKGWKGSYPLREITQTPCWVECMLIVPLHWLDKVLKEIPRFHKKEPHSHT